MTPFRIAKIQKVFSIVACTVTLLVLILFYVKNVIAPRLAREHVETRFPGVQVIGDISVDLFKADFRSVAIRRRGLQGKLKLVRVYLHFSWDDLTLSSAGIEIEGGHLSWNKNVLTYPPPSKGSSGGKGVDIQALHLDTLNVTWGGIEGVARNVRLSEEKDKACCAEGAILLSKGFKYSMFVKDGRVDLGRFCIGRDRQISLDSVSTTIRLPSTIPGIPHNNPEYDTLAKNIRLDMDERDIVMGSLNVEDLFKSDLTVLRSESGHLDIEADNLTTDHPWIAYTKDGEVEPVTFPQARVKVPYNPLGTIEVFSQKVGLDVDLRKSRLSGAASCSDWAHALPVPTVPALRNPGFLKGDLSFSVDASPHSSAIDLEYNCQATCEDPLIQDLSGEFQYFAYASDGMTTAPRTTGPGSQDWVPLLSLPVHVPEAFINLEDPSFLKHRGLLRGSLVAALKSNIQSRRFNIGGSTISQQLAKNLWLTRDRSVTRKAQEALLTLALESCLTKGKILELYMNVVEYAPEVYGIGPASQHYFSKDAQDLLPEEAYFLANALPHPKHVIPPDQGGLDKTRYLMSQLAESGRIPKGLLIHRTPLDTVDWDVLE